VDARYVITEDANCGKKNTSFPSQRTLKENENKDCAYVTREKKAYGKTLVDSKICHTGLKKLGTLSIFLDWCPIFWAFQFIVLSGLGEQ